MESKRVEDILPRWFTILKEAYVRQNKRNKHRKEETQRKVVPHLQNVKS